MARELTFKLKNKEYSGIPVRSDRRKLYGWVEIRALDDDGEPCRLVSTDQSGLYIIPKSGTGLGVVTPEGLWVDRSQLITVDAQGREAELIPSSFNTVVDLRETVSEEEFLDHSITSIYELTDIGEDFRRAVGKKIYYFRYCYVEECEGLPAFVLSDEDGGVYLLVGFRNQFDMLGLEQPGVIDDYDDDGTEEDDDLDFSMF